MTNGPNMEMGIPALDRGIEVEHVADAGDRSLDRVAGLALEKGLPIRVRMSLSLWDWSQYVAWKGQTWRVEVADKAQAEAAKEALEGFFDLLARKGPQRTAEMLGELMAAEQEIEAAGDETEAHNEPTE